VAEVHGRGSRLRGTALCLVSAAGFGVAAVFATESYRAGVSVPTMPAVRFAIAAAVFWAVTAWRRPALPTRRVLLTCVALGAVGYAFQAGLYFSSLARISASLTALLLYTYPSITVFAVVLRRESADRRCIAGLACSAAGLVLLLGTSKAGSPVLGGVLSALGAAAAYASTSPSLTGCRRTPGCGRWAPRPPRSSRAQSRPSPSPRPPWSAANA
jgi:drug/metabolite transporter (DMT)-like permease